MYVKQQKSEWRKKIVLSVCALFLLSGTIWAQNIGVTGKVTDKDNFPLAGVSVSVTGTRQIVSTRSDGTFSISAPANGSLTFAMIGMVTQVVQVNNRTQMNVTLQEDALVLEDVVVVAYGTQKKENLSGAVSVVNVEKTLVSRPVVDVGRALQGSTPGLSITTQSGALGGDPTFRLRAHYVSMGQGNANPLILLDNVEIPSLSYVNPNDIESISTLKDAATTAIYGARAANGAILITTKKGSRESKVSVSYTSNFAWATTTRVPTHSRPDLELEYSWLQRNGARLRNGDAAQYEFNHIGPVWYDQDMIKKVKVYWDTYGYGKEFGREMVEGRDFEKRAAGGFYFYRGWDLERELFKKWTPQQTHNVSVSGGTETVTYNVSAGYMKQNGVLNQFDDYFARLNFAGNVTTKVNKYITLRSGFMYTKTDQAIPFNFGDNATYDPYYYIDRWFSTYPSGTYKGIETRNGMAEQRMVRDNPTKDNNWFNRLNLGATVNIFDGFTANFDYTYTFTDWGKKTIGGIPRGINTFNNTPAGADLDYYYYTAPVFRTDRDYVRMDNSKNVRNAYNGNLLYDKTFGKHHVKAIVGCNFEDAEWWMHWSRRDNVNDYNLPEINLAGGPQSVGSDHTWWSIVGFFGRVNYEFNNKYLFEVNFRRDASSKFRDGMRWASYPSGSVAWRVSEENFWKPIKYYVNSLKLRGSYGTNGNQTVPSGLYNPTITQGTNIGDTNLRYWLINGAVANWVGGLTNSLTPSAGGPAVVNPDLTWEKNAMLDLGVDVRFWRDMFGLTFDWYEKKSTGLITAGSVLPSTFGAAAPRVNFGELTTKGFEIELNFNKSFSNGLRINASAQLSDWKSVVTKFASADKPLYSDEYYQGKVMGEIWGYQVERLFQKDDFVWENGKIQTVVINGKTIHVLKNLKPEYQWQNQPGNGGLRTSPGDVMFKDLNGDGIIDYGTNRVGDTGDRTIIGNRQPRYMYSFRIGTEWKGVDFDVFFQGVGKRDQWATGNGILPGWMASEANFSHTLDYWTEDNPNAYYPRPFDAANPTSDVNRFNYVPNDRYLLNLAYLRLKSLTIGYTLPRKLTQKIMVNRLRAYATGENLFEFNKLRGVNIDPEIDWTTGGTENDARAFGRSYPYRRTFSLGIQVVF